MSETNEDEKREGKVDGKRKMKEKGRGKGFNRQAHDEVETQG